MRNKGRIIALLVVVVALFGVWFLVEKVLPADEAASASPSASNTTDVVDIVPLDQDQLVKMVLKTPEETITMNRVTEQQTQRTQNEDGSITTTTAAIELWTSPDLRLDTDAAQKLAIAGGHFTTLRRVVEQASDEDKKTFGFDSATEVTFHSADKSFAVLLGGKTPTEDGWYVMQPGNPAIYTAGKYTVEPLTYDRLDFIAKEPYGRVDTFPTDITAIRFERDGKPLLAARYEADNYWHLYEPVAIKGEAEPFTAMATAFAGLKAAEHVGLASGELAQYGLDKPRYLFTFTVAGAEHRLQVGGKDADGKLYCRIDDGETVFTADATSFTFLDKPFVELIEKFVFIPTIYNTTHMTITIDGRTDVLDFDVPTPKDNPDNKLPETYVLNGTKLEGNDSISGVKRYYQGAIGVRADKVDFAATPAYEPAKSVMTIEYVLRNMDMKYAKVELLPTPDGYGYYGFLNGKYTGLIISRTQMDEDSMGIRAGYTEMLEKIEKDKQEAAAASATPAPSSDAK